MKITLPNEVKSIIESLEKEGYEAYAVGGCVRDSILGRVPKDWDITTDALPNEIKRIFPVTIDTGIAHGTVTVRKNKKSFEVTTYRIDGEYLDKRHPDSVTFIRELKEDLRRRDFTVNALAYSEKTGVVDEFGGLADLENKIIRCVEDPYRRFEEDALRMLRAVRFSAQLGFSVEDNTKKAIRSLANSLSSVSAERICDELIKLICSDCPKNMMLLYDLGLSKVFLPEWDKMVITPQNTKHHRGSVAEHTVFVLEGVANTKKMRLAALLHDVAKPICKKQDTNGNDHFAGHPQVGANIAKNIMKRLKLDNDTMDYVYRLILFHDDRPPITEKNVRRCINRMGRDLIPDLLDLRHADIMGQSDYKRQEKLDLIEEFRVCYEEILKKEQCVDIKDLKINGSDCLSMGIPKGPKVGEVLKEALELVLEEPEKNNREFLEGFVKQRANE